MSKKKNKKFKKSHSSNIVSPSITISRSETVIADRNDNQEQSVVAETKVVETVKLDPYQELDQKYRFVRHEVKKILAIMGVLALILVGVMVAGSKTAAFDSIGNYLYRLANIQTQ